MIEIRRLIHRQQIDEGISSHHPQLCTDTVSEISGDRAHALRLRLHDFAGSMNWN
jgi:hypothetical protein